MGAITALLSQERASTKLDMGEILKTVLWREERVSGGEEELGFRETLDGWSIIPQLWFLSVNRSLLAHF